MLLYILVIFDFVSVKLGAQCTVATLAVEIRWSDELITGSLGNLGWEESELEIQIDRHYFEKIGLAWIRTLHMFGSIRFGNFMSCAVAASIGGVAHWTRAKQ